MATETQTPAADVGTIATTPAPKAPPKPVTVIEGMDSRRMFDNVELAANYLNKCGESFVDFEAVPKILNGIITEGEDAGNFDPAIYTDSTRVMVSVLANRGEKGQPSTAKAIIVTPAPSLESILTDGAGKAWLAKIIDKELNHVAVRVLRTADDMDKVQDQMPLTLADYVSSSRESNGGIMESFNTLFKGIIAALAAKSPAWAKARFIKTELRKAFESKAYALEYFSALEDRGDKPSMLVMGLQLGKREAEKQGLDPAIFDKWLAERDSKPLLTKEQEAAQDDDFDLDDLAFEEAKPEATDSNTTPGTDPVTDPAFNVDDSQNVTA